ncbi:MAG: GNAT family N-acetyltransferase [Bacteroidota bacterium]|nr:GNAT family N-acetyltransferase [Bacteroidota bacterium]MDP3146246.1 GNAT family N-acetyltransferase [Bacteroidota bacterium]
MQNSSLLLNPVSENDLNQIAELAKTIWQKHYVPIIGQEQVDYMLQKIYNYDSLLDQIKNKNQNYYFIQSNNTTIGFLSVTPEENNCWMLNKFYLLEETAGKGFGSIILEKLKNSIKPKKIKLTVNRNNIKSINFYFKNGFTIESSAIFDIGNGYVMDDFIMVWQQG